MTPPDLTDAEKLAARSFRMSAEEYETFKDRTYQPAPAADRKHEDLKQAIREALDERDRARSGTVNGDGVTHGEA